MKIGFSAHYQGDGGARSWIKSFSTYCQAKGHVVIYGYNPSVDVFCSVADLSTMAELQELRKRTIRILQRVGAIYLPYNYPTLDVVKLNTSLAERMLLANSIVYQSIFCKNVLFRSVFNGREPDGSIIYNGVDSMQFTAKGHASPRNRSKKLVLAIAYWGTPANAAYSVEVLLRVAKELLGRTDIEFWVLGKACSEVTTQIQQANLPNITKLDLSRPIPRELMPSYFRTADLVLHLKAHEGCSNGVLEVMHTGTPLVGLNSGSLPELVGDAALLANCSQSITTFPEVDINDLRQKMLHTLDNQDFYRKMMLSRAKLFSQHELNEKYLDILSELCK